MVQGLITHVASHDMTPRSKGQGRNVTYPDKNCNNSLHYRFARSNENRSSLANGTRKPKIPKPRFRFWFDKWNTAFVFLFGCVSDCERGDHGRVVCLRSCVGGRDSSRGRWPTQTAVVWRSHPGRLLRWGSHCLPASQLFWGVPQWRRVFVQLAQQPLL